jgi:hypothetical protein
MLQARFYEYPTLQNLYEFKRVIQSAVVEHNMLAREATPIIEAAEEYYEIAKKWGDEDEM